MRADDKKQKQLLDELHHLRQRVAEMEKEKSERKRSESALRESEEKFRLAFRTSPDSINLNRLSDGMYLDINEGFTKIMGYAPEEVIGKTSLDLDIWENPKDRVRLVAALKRDGFIENLEAQFRGKDGRIRFGLMSARVLRVNQEDVILSITRDITELKRAQQALQDREKRYRLLFNSVKDALFVLEGPSDGLPGKFIEVNDSACERLGYTREEFLQMTPIDIDAPETVDRIPAIMERLLAEEQVRWEGIHRTKDGKRVPVEISNHLFDLDGKLMVFSSARDITDRLSAERENEELQAQLRRAQKMEAVGTLAGGIAHDFNNILAAIIGYTEMAASDLPESDPINHDLQQVLRAAHRAKDLVKQILVFSRMKSEEERIPVNIGSTIREALKLLRATLPATIEIRQSIPGEPCMALADPMQIRQVIVNLCTNAAHAMEEKGGVLEVTLDAVDFEATAIPPSPEIKPGTYLKLKVNDTGRGMDSVTLERIFDPYYTTKEVGKGSGLGLAVVLGIIKRHEGTVTVTSAPGQGSTFQVYIPRIKSEAAQEMEDASPLPKGTESILWVDDEEALGKLGQKMLRGLGYEVVTNTSPAAAVEIFRAQPDLFDLVITDYTMPKMTGTDLAKEIMRIRTDIPVILCTGFNDRIDEEKASQMGIAEFLMKPLTRRILAEAVRNVLDSRKDTTEPGG